MTSRALKILAVATAALLLAYCASPDAEDTPPTPTTEPPEPSVVTAEEMGLFTRAALELTVMELGVVCEGGWKVTDEYRNCIDLSSEDAWFTIVEPPDHDAMRSSTWVYPHLAIAVWNDDLGFVYPDSCAGEWSDPIIDDCMAGDSPCYMQTGEDDPALLNEE